jgi:hypothetical protein
VEEVIKCPLAIILGSSRQRKTTNIPKNSMSPAGFELTVVKVKSFEVSYLNH